VHVVSRLALRGREDKAMSKRKADAKSSSVLDLLRIGSVAPRFFPSPSPPRKARRSRKSFSPRHAEEQRGNTSPTPVTLCPESAANRDKDELWNFVWANVETPEAKAPRCLPEASPTPAGMRQLHARASWPQSGRKSPQTSGKCPQTCRKSPEQPQHIVPYVRRRIVGKQPPVLSIEVYTRRRLRGKQPAPVVPERKVISVRGHYDVLGVARTATAAEIHASYRRRALATHPDKGGDPRDFHRVKTAFEELSDEARRTVYDRSLVLFGRRDGMTSEESVRSTQVVSQQVGKPSDHDMYFGAARVAHFTLLANSGDTWPACLAKMQDGVLGTLRDILKGSKSLAAPADKGAGAAGSGNLQGWQGPTCITHRKSGYKVTVSWAELSICTGFTKSLTQVIDWQIALLGMQGVAQLRMKRKGRAESTDPLTENELLQVLEREPGLELTFTITVSVGSKGKKIWSPGVMDLHTAMEFRCMFLKAMQGKNSEAALKVEKQQAEQEAIKEKKKRRLLEQKLLVAVNEELQARSAGRSRGTADHSSKALVLHQHQTSQHDNVKTPTPKEKTLKRKRSATSPCKATKRRTQIEAPVSRQRKSQPAE